MPAPAPLTPAQQAQVTAGLCGCGCGQPLPREQLTRWHTPAFCSHCDPTGEKTTDAPKQRGHYGSQCAAEDCERWPKGGEVPDGEGATVGRWFSRTHGQRAYRQRVKAGTRRTKRDRQRTAELAQADTLDQEVKWAESRSKSAAKEALDKAARAQSIRERWALEDGGQLSLAPAAK